MKRLAAAPALAVLAAATLGAGPPRAGEVELELEKLNRVYSDIVGELAPLAMDPVTVRLSSPRQLVVVRDHVARLAPLGGGRAEGTLEIELIGKGELVADVDIGGQVSRLTDELVLPPQRLVLDGAIRLTRIEGGYRIRAERAPERVAIEVRSRLIDQIASLCEGASLLALGALDCAPLTRALERPSVPLPAAGGEYFLADTELTDADRGELDALIAAPAPR